MQRGHAHARNVRQVFHSQRLSIIRTYPGNHFRRTVALLSYGGDRSQSLTFRAPKNTVNNLALN